MEELKYFFSYAREDSAFVLRLAKELREVGINLWLDQLDIVGGQRWDRAVEEALKACQGMIAVLSPDALASNNVMDEVSYALEERKIVIPILLRPCTIPFRLRRVQYIDFTADYNTGFSQLLRALRIDQPSQPRVPAAPEDTVVQGGTAPSQETPKEVPTPEQLPIRAEPPEPTPPAPAKLLRKQVWVTSMRWAIGVFGLILIGIYVYLNLPLGQPKLPSKPPELPPGVNEKDKVDGPKPIDNNSIFLIPTANITIDGNFGDWRGIQPVIDDPLPRDRDRTTDFPGTDLKAFYLARDQQYLYLAMTLHDGLPSRNLDTVYFFVANQRQFEVNVRGDMDAAVMFSNGNWNVWTDERDTGGPPVEGTRKVYHSSFVKSRPNFIEWKVPLKAMGNLNGRFVHVYIHVVGPRFEEPSDWKLPGTELKIN
jgi:TIR domain